MSESWTYWCNGKFDGLKDGLYIVFRTNNNGNPLYVLKHYQPDKENKLDIHNPITILQKDKHNNDYQSELELGRGNDVGDTGFVKKGEEYIGIYDLPDNAKYNNRDSIKNKLDNESTINNFYEHGIYDWLIADAIMEHMGAEEVQETREKSVLSDEITKLKAEQQKQMEEYQTRISYIFHLYSLFYGNYTTWDTKYNLINDKVDKLDKNLVSKIHNELNNIVNRKYTETTAKPILYDKFSEKPDSIQNDVKYVNDPSTYIVYAMAGSIYDMYIQAKETNDSIKSVNDKIKEFGGNIKEYTYIKEIIVSDLKTTMKNIKNIHEVNQQMTEDHSNKFQKLGDLESEIKSNDNRIKSLESEINEKNAEIEKINQEKREIKSKKMDSHNDDNKQLQIDLNTAQSELKTVQEKLKEAQAKNTENTNENDSLKEQLKEKEEHINSLTDQIQSINFNAQVKESEALSRLQYELDYLNNQLGQLQNKNQNLNQQLSSEQGKIEGLIEALKKLQNLSKDTMEKIQNINSDNINMNSINDIIESLNDTKLKELIILYKASGNYNDILTPLVFEKFVESQKAYTTNLSKTYYGNKTNQIALYGARSEKQNSSTKEDEFYKYEQSTADKVQNYINHSKNIKIKEVERINKAIVKITEILNSDFRYILAIYPSLKVGKFTFEEAWQTFLNETRLNRDIDSSGSSGSSRNDVLRFLYVDTMYEHWEKYGEWQAKWDQNHYKFQTIIDKFTTEREINSNKVFLKLLEVFESKTIGYVASNSTNIYKENPLHIADLIEIYKHYTRKNIQNPQDTDTEKYCEVIRRVFIKYILNIENTTLYKFEPSILNKIKRLKLENDKNMDSLNDSKIITMVKINNYSNDSSKTGNPDKWNGSYIPYFNNNYLRVAVENHADNHDQTDNTRNNDNLIVDYESNAFDKNKKSFTFGGFSKVFKPNQPGTNYNKNEDIVELMDSEQTKTIINTIIKGKNAFIFGYGASGAGKTAMLVYNNNKNSVGYCVELCNKICEKIAPTTTDVPTLRNYTLELTFTDDTIIKNLEKIKNATLNVLLKDGNDISLTGGTVLDELNFRSIQNKTITFTHKDDADLDDNDVEYLKNELNDKFYIMLEFRFKGSSINYIAKVFEINDLKSKMELTLEPYNKDQDYILENGSVTLEIDNLPKHPTMASFTVDFTEFSTYNQTGEEKTAIHFSYKNGSITSDGTVMGYSDINENERPPVLAYALKRYITNTGKDRSIPLNYGTRMIEPTRNNDESSRSHILCTFSFEGHGKLFIADLAGVENKFDESDATTILQTYENINKANKWDIDLNENEIKNVITITGNEKEKENLINKLNEISNNETNYKLTNIDKNNGKIKLNQSEDVNLQLDLGFFKNYFTNEKTKKKINFKQLSDTTICELYKTLSNMNSVQEWKKYYDCHFTYNETKTPRYYLDPNKVKNYIDGLKLYLISGLFLYKNDYQCSVNSETKRNPNMDFPYVWINKQTFTVNNTTYTMKYNVNNPPAEGTKFNTLRSVHIKDDLNTIKLDDVLEIFEETNEGMAKDSEEYRELLKQKYEEKYQMYKNDIIDRFKNGIIKTDGNIDTYNLHTMTKVGKHKSWFSNMYPGVKKPSQNELIFIKSKYNNIENDIQDFNHNKEEIINKLASTFSSYNKDDINRLFTETELKNYKNSLEIKRKLEELNKNTDKLQKYSTKYQKNKSKIEGSIKVIEKMSKVIKSINERTKEGMYINNQLSLLRDDIFRAVIDKSDGILFTSPRIEPNCVDTVCNSKMDPEFLCYMMNCKSNHQGKNISNIIKKTCETTGVNDCNLKDLLIVVFTVFNISDKNPLNTPTISIRKIDNQLSLPYYAEPTVFISLDPLLNAYNTYLKDYRIYNSSNEKDKTESLSRLKKSIEPLNKQLNDLKGILEKEDTHTSIINIGTTGEGSLINNITKAKDSSEIDTNNTKTGYIEKIIEMINTHNATTPIGTLMFTDAIAKYSNKICDKICDSEMNKTTLNEYKFAIDMHEDKINKLYSQVSSKIKSIENKNNK